MSISNDVLALVDFEHHLKFNLHDDVHGLSECRGTMNLDGQVAFCMMWQHDPSHASRVRSKPKKMEFRLKGFGGHLSTVRVHGIENVVNAAQHYTFRLGA